MMNAINYPPAFLLIIGAVLVPLIPERVRSYFVIALPALTFAYIYTLSTGDTSVIPFLHYDLETLRVDKLSKAFGYIFTLNAFAAFIYGYFEKRAYHHSASLVYIGSALGVVFAGDLLTLYIFWEMMAISSMFLILARNTTPARQAATRYILVHVLGGLVLLAGILLHINQTGSLAFNSFDTVDVSTVLILIGFLINAAAVPFSSWLPDAYPEASVLGGVILSAYTSKTAVYTLLRGYPGWEVLIIIGCAMSIYGIIYALLENDMRRILAYSIVNQVGFMVCAAGIGTPLAIAGAVAHAFCHIIYKALLWMSAGAVLYRTGKSKCTDLGGLYITMPWTLIFGTIGALAISSVPFTSGFTSKTIIILASELQGFFWAWLILEIASAGVFLHAGIKFPYFVFFATDKGLRPKEAPKCMLFGMAILSFLCIYLGCFPESLYNILPDTDVVKAAMPVTFTEIYVGKFEKVVTQTQLLIFSGLVFFLALKLLKRTDTIALDFDWFYRKGGKFFYVLMDRALNGLNKAVDHLFVNFGAGKLADLSTNFSGILTSRLLGIVWKIFGIPEKQIDQMRAKVMGKIATGTVSIGYSAIGAMIALSVLILW